MPKFHYKVTHKDNDGDIYKIEFFRNAQRVAEHLGWKRHFVYDMTNNPSRIKGQTENVASRIQNISVERLRKPTTASQKDSESTQ